MDCTAAQCEPKGGFNDNFCVFSVNLVWARRAGESESPDPVRDWENMRVLQHPGIADARVDAAKERVNIG